MRLLTRAGWGVLLACGVALLSGWLFGLPELLILGVSLLVLLVGAGATTMFTSLRLEVVRSLHPDRVHAGSASRVEVLVRNRGRRRTPVLTLRDGVSGTAGAELLLAPLECNGRIRAAYRLPTRRRGVITVGPLEVEMGDPFGLTQVAVMAAPASTLVVYPAVEDVAAASRSDGMDPHGWRTPGLQTGGDEFHSLRPYVMGDDLRRVHWPSTARRDELTVRQDERHQQGRTTVLLDVRRAVHTNESFERAVSAAASLLVAAVRRGDEVRLVATDGTDSGYGAGPTSVSSMLEYLAAVATTDRGDEVRVDHPGTLVALTTPAGVSTTGSAAGPGRRFLVVFERSPEDGSGAIAGPSTIRVGVDQSFAAAWGAARAGPGAAEPGMTATLEDRTASEAEAEVGVPVEDSPPPPPRTLILAEAALIGVSLATVIGYARLFADGAFLLPIALAAVLGHLVAIALRRIGLGPFLSTVAHLALLPIVLTWARYWETKAYFLPTGLTIETVGDDLAEAWKIFLDISAPVPAAPGFIAVAMVTAWVVALASDSLAFRLDATVEALAPATGLFLFSSILAEREHRTTSALLFVVAVLVFVLASRVARADGTGRWLATDAGRGARSLLAAGLLLAGLAVIPAVLAGPRLPGGDGRPLVDLDGGGSSNDRVTLSPLVDIRSRLVEQATVEAFRVEAAAPSYWRITALDAFDGQIWSSSGNYVGVEGRLPSTPDPVPGATRLSQTFHIAALDQIWLPAAFEPIAVDSPDADVDWDGDSSSLVVAAGRETSDGLEYSVLSILPRVGPDALTVGTAGLDTEFLARFTRLPEATLPIARRFAAEAVGTETDAYGQALALQNWFRTHFRYSLDVRPGHGTDALAAFLDPLGSRSGYCEQFAGAYAALARALGLPARVAVGFTPGEEDVDDPGTFIVRGINAHAWPELYFAGVGWVPFEPTPGRGLPGAEAYTHVAPDQVDPNENVVPTTVPSPATTGSLAPRPGTDDPLPEFFDPNAGHGGLTATQVVALALALVVGTWFLGVPTVAGLRRARNRHRSHGQPDLEVTDAWDDSVRALALLDLVPHGAETPTEFATRAAKDAGTDRDAHRELALLTTAAAFGRASHRTDSVRARQTADTVIGRARRLAGPWRRFQAAVSPRRLRRG